MRARGCRVVPASAVRKWLIQHNRSQGSTHERKGADTPSGSPGRHIWSGWASGPGLKAGDPRSAIRDPRTGRIEAAARNSEPAQLVRQQMVTPSGPGASRHRAPPCVPLHAPRRGCRGGASGSTTGSATPALADRLDDEDSPAQTMGRAAEMIGSTSTFLRASGQARLIVPLRSEGGRRRYSRVQLRLPAHARELVDAGTPVDAACQITFFGRPDGSGGPVHQRRAAGPTGRGRLNSAARSGSPEACGRRREAARALGEGGPVWHRIGPDWPRCWRSLRPRPGWQNAWAWTGPGPGRSRWRWPRPSPTWPGTPWTAQSCCGRCTARSTRASSSWPWTGDRAWPTRPGRCATAAPLPGAWASAWE